MPRLLHEAAQQLKGKDIEIIERGRVTWRATGCALTLLGISWLEMLEAIENVTSSDDLRQLRGFCEYLEAAVFLPFASACRIHFCSVSELPMPSFCATAPIAAHSDEYSGHRAHRALTQLRGILC